MSFGFGFALPAYPLRGGGGNNPFNQSGPTLDLSFTGVVTDLTDPNGYTLNTDFIIPQYQIAAQYVVWETGVGLVDKTFSQIITFTRASTGTFFDSAGVLQSAAIDAPRFDYDPSTLAARGFLIEEARTNLLLQSQFVSGWTVNAGTLTANVTASPDGTTDAASFIEDSTNAARNINQSSQTFTAGVTITGSLFVKQTGGATRHFRIQISSNAGANGFRAYFDLATNTVATQTLGFGTGTAVANSATITPVGNGWYRLSASGTVDPAAISASGMGFMQDTPSGSAAYTGNGTSGLYIWGAQLEAGAFPTSYIPTTTTALTRSADVASVNTLSPWFNSVSGTLFAEVQRLSSVSNNGAMAGFNDGSTNNRLQTRIDGATTNSNFIVLAGTVNYSGIFTFISGGVNKAALAYETNNVNSAGNGVVGTTDTSEVLPTGLTKLDLGQVTGAGVLNGWLRRVSYFPRRLANAELQSLTS